MRRASIKETGEELSQEEWARFDAAVAQIRAERQGDAEQPRCRTEPAREPDDRAAQRN